MDVPLFQSRSEKEIFLKEIIQKLNITEPEKDIYSICIEVLEERDFETFFEKIFNQLQDPNRAILQQEPLNLIL